jgi:methylglutaconyl-CoA hydratase
MFSLNSSGIATLSLNNPQRHNTFDEQLLRQLLDSLIRIEQDPSIRVVLLRAEGKYFCAGGDLHWMQRMGLSSQDENHADVNLLARVMYTLRQLPQPTIACVQGSAYGGGVGLVACCDIALATPDAHFCLSEVTLGLVPAVISPYVLAAIGERAARRYFLTAERFDAEQAKTLGLIHEVVSSDALMHRADELATQLLNNAPSAMRITKQLLSQIASHPINPDIITATVDCLTVVRSSEEAQEGIRAFFEKRPPNWRL